MGEIRGKIIENGKYIISVLAVLLLVTTFVLTTTVKTEVEAVEDVMAYGSDAGKVDYITYQLRQIKIDIEEEDLNAIEENVMKIASTIEEKEAREEVYNRISNRKSKYELSLINLHYLDYVEGRLKHKEFEETTMERVDYLMTQIVDDNKEEIKETHMELRKEAEEINKEFESKKVELEKKEKEAKEQEKEEDRKSTGLFPRSLKEIPLWAQIAILLAGIGVAGSTLSKEEGKSFTTQEGKKIGKDFEKGIIGKLEHLEKVKKGRSPEDSKFFKLKEVRELIQSTENYTEGYRYTNFVGTLEEKEKYKYLEFLILLKLTGNQNNPMKELNKAIDLILKEIKDNKEVGIELNYENDKEILTVVQVYGHRDLEDLNYKKGDKMWINLVVDRDIVTK